MKLNPPLTLARAAALLDCSYLGTADHLITGINEIHRVEPGDATFVDVAKYFRKALDSAATTIIINQRVDPPSGKGLLIHPDPFTAFNALLEWASPYRPFVQSVPLAECAGISPEARLGHHVVIGENVRIEAGATIGHHVVIGNNVVIGRDTVFPHVTLYDDVQVGARCRIQAGAVLGSEAFYYKKRPDGTREPMLTKGRVLLGDEVHIGANTTIDRGVTADTSIGDHTKIDNLCQIGHDTVIGKYCVLAAQVGVAGVTTIADECILWGQVGVSSDAYIGPKSIILAKSGVMGALPGGRTYFGLVAQEARKTWRELVAVQQLPELLARLRLATGLDSTEYEAS